jgi:NADPH:quinone reductase-like Zn-dependent oxidoreductase
MRAVMGMCGLGVAALLVVSAHAGRAEDELRGTTMRAVVVVDGAPVVRQVPVPDPGPGDVRVRVHAAGVNPVDWKRARRSSASTIPGFDASGTIDTVGAGVTGWSRGDAVIVFAGSGGAYAEYVVVPARDVVAKPEALTFEEAAGIPTVALTAYDTVYDQADIQQGQRILIHGGAGGVGSAAVQLAKVRGAYVLATASARNHAFLRSIGVDEPIDYRTTPFETVVDPVDVVLNAVDEDTARRSVALVAPGGLLLSVAGGVPVAACAAANVRCAARQSSTPAGVVLRAVAHLASEGRYRVHVDEVFPLARTADAWTLNETGRTRGKIVVRVGE